MAVGGHRTLLAPPNGHTKQEELDVLEPIAHPMIRSGVPSLRTLLAGASGGVAIKRRAWGGILYVGVGRLRALPR